MQIQSGLKNVRQIFGNEDLFKNELFIFEMQSDGFKIKKILHKVSQKVTCKTILDDKEIEPDVTYSS